MLVIAHRGANREALENSFAAFDLAVGGGAARIELDVHLTADGQVVVHHDDVLGELVEPKARGLCLGEWTRADLTAIRLINGEPLPFLDQVLERYLPQIELNIEIKGRNPALASAVARLVARHHQRERVIVSCFHLAPLVAMRTAAPAVARACLLGSDTFEWPGFAIITPTVFLERAGATILHPHVRMVNENLMDQAAARGWRVYAWAPMAGEEQDREGVWTALATLGLHGLCTNYPRQLRRWLMEATTYDHAWIKHGRVV